MLFAPPPHVSVVMNDSAVRQRSPNRSLGLIAFLLIASIFVGTLTPHVAHGQSPGGGMGTGGTGGGTGGTGTGGSSGSGGTGSTSSTWAAESLEDALDYLHAHPQATDANLELFTLLQLDEAHVIECGGVPGELLLLYLDAANDPDVLANLAASQTNSPLSAPLPQVFSDPDYPSPGFEEAPPMPGIPPVPNPTPGLPVGMQGHPHVFRKDDMNSVTIHYHRVIDYDPANLPNPIPFSVEFREKIDEIQVWEGTSYYDAWLTQGEYMEGAAELDFLKRLRRIDRNVRAVAVSAEVVTAIAAAAALTNPATMGIGAVYAFEAAALHWEGMKLDDRIAQSSSKITFLATAELPVFYKNVTKGKTLPKVTKSFTTVGQFSGWTPVDTGTMTYWPVVNGTSITVVASPLAGQSTMDRIFENMSVTAPTEEEAINELPLELRALYRARVGL